jgi:hypothetical protein
MLDQQDCQEQLDLLLKKYGMTIILKSLIRILRDDCNNVFIDNLRRDLQAAEYEYAKRC